MENQFEITIPQQPADVDLNSSGSTISLYFNEVEGSITTGEELDIIDIQSSIQEIQEDLEDIIEDQTHTDLVEDINEQEDAWEDSWQDLEILDDQEFGDLDFDL